MSFDNSHAAHLTVAACIGRRDKLRVDPGPVIAVFGSSLGYLNEIPEQLSLWLPFLESKTLLKQHGGTRMFYLKYGIRTIIVALMFTLVYLLAFDSTVLVRQLAKIDSGRKHYKGDYQFGADWFTYNIRVWNRILVDFKGKANLSYLEIGVYEGRSAIWMLENILTHSSARVTAIDIFPDDLQQKFIANLEKAGARNKVNILKGKSQEKLRGLPLNSFDIVYVDGSHRAKHVFLDAALAWDLLKDGGLLIFDDYPWPSDRFPMDLRPKMPIDTFLLAFGDELELVHKDWQVAVRKVKGACQKYLCSTVGNYGYAWLKRELYDLSTDKTVELSDSEKSALERFLRSYQDIRLDRRELAKAIEKNSVLRSLQQRIGLLSQVREVQSLTPDPAHL